MLRSLALFACAVIALSSPSVLREARERPLRGANSRQRIEPHALLPMRIALVPNAEAMRMAESWLLDVSDPTSANYGNHWSQEAVIDAFKPTDETANAVRDWLPAHGIHEVTHTDNKQWLAFDLPARKAEKLFNTKYFEHINNDGHFEASCDEYYLPQHLQAHIDFMTPALKDLKLESKMPPVLRLATPQPAVTAHTKNFSLCATPLCVREQYNISLPDPSTPVSPQNHLGIYEAAAAFCQGDLDYFWTHLTDIPNGTTPFIKPIDGGVVTVHDTNATSCKALQYPEGDLDIEMAQPIIYPQNITVFPVYDSYYDTGPEIDGHFPGLFNTFLDGLDGSYCTYCAHGECGDASFDPSYPDKHKGGYKGELQCGVYKPTNVISLSYDVFDTYYPFNYERRQCNEYLKLGLQGVSFFFSSGDSGVGYCTGNQTFFETSTPSDCPWVTAVGATYITPDLKEHAAQLSGGGFSLVFDGPKYQQKDVEHYFNISNPPYPYLTNGNYNSSGKYNRNGRAIPYISALGLCLALVYRTQLSDGGGGTSASAPLATAIFNRVVEERLRVGKKALGFLNPSMYQNPQLFNDITKGNNPGCGTKGFEAAVGWDPVTGLGTPNYGKLVEYYMSLK